MTNPGFIPPVDWDLQSDGEQNSQDLRTYSLQLESEIERLEAWETKAVSQYYFGADETDSWDSDLCNSQTKLMLDLWREEYDEPPPFVRKAFRNFIGRMTLPEDVILLHQSIISACAESAQNTPNLDWEERNEDLREAAADHCASRWADPRYRSVLRCILEPDGFVNVIREGALARTRFWIKRILNGKFTVSSREDLVGLIRISKAVLSRVRAAYTWEAPSSFLGADDLEIVKWTYPLVCGIPAECSVSKKQLRKEWKAGRCEFGNWDWVSNDFKGYADARKFLEYSRWYHGKYRSRANPTAYDVDGECRQVGLGMIAIALREAERFGLPSIDMPSIHNENDSAEFVDKILRLTIAEMPLKGTLQAITSRQPSKDGANLRERSPDNPPQGGKRQVSSNKRGKKPATIEMISEACRVHIAYQEQDIGQTAFCEWWNGSQGKNRGAVKVGVPWLRRKLALVRKLMREEPHRIPARFANKLKPLRRSKRVPQKKTKKSRRTS